MRYILIQDFDCHWFVIPQDKEEEWYQYCQDLNYADEREDQVYPPEPDWANSVGGAPSLVSFENPVFK